MPTLAQGEARTIVVNPSGPPSNTLTAVLPPGVTISLESVLAAIDASGAGDTTALLEIADSSGAVIARKAQGQKVTGGTVGSATWALRLGDESAQSAPGSGIQFDTDNQGGWLDVTANNTDTVGAGIRMVDDSGGYTVIENGGNGALTLNRLGTGAVLAGEPAVLSGVNTARVVAGSGAGPAGIGIIATVNVGGTAAIALQAMFCTIGLSSVAGVTSITHSSQKLGFYGVPAVARAAHPTTLAQVITLLTNLGLCS